ncbi:hypothetical protein [Vibrio hippocampi]|uniref:Uncharacterized protein n=1 Tax=Vibrio hippocampi TaxID=654686 RepID=A0ABM8ZGT2_9VIBR|nr:hypothetical protein [Vibrio hippocampi]CAH0525869.1 hypothetical protein VHP8226_01375 [Vibrio hippocampi]
MNHSFNLEQDNQQLQLILNLDFLNNLLSLVILISCLLLTAWAWDTGHYAMLIATVAAIIYVYQKYYGNNLDNMHHLKLTDKLLTKRLASKHQYTLAANFSTFIVNINDIGLYVDPWELKKLFQFIATQELDNPTAFIIRDLYKIHLLEQLAITPESPPLVSS